MSRRTVPPRSDAALLTHGLAALVLLAAVVASATAAADEHAATDAAALERALEQADETRGRRLFLQCRACHSLEKGGINSVGPNLYDFFGKKAGHAEGFSYSDVLADSGVVWTPETLDAWLARPSSFLPGNRLIFAGVDKLQDRADLILYLQRATAREE